MSEENEQQNSAQDTATSAKEEKQQKEQERTQAGQAARDLGKKAGKKLEQEAEQAAKEAIKEAVTTGTATIGGTIAIIIVVLILVIGLISFILTMPGAITNKLSEIADGISNYLFGDNRDLSEVTEEEKMELLQYIQDMGFDVVGYGFVPKIEVGESTEKDEDGEESVKEDAIIGFSETLPTDVVNEEDARKMSVYKYIVAANRAYTINDNGNIVEAIADRLGIVTSIMADVLDVDSWQLSEYRGMITINVKGFAQEKFIDAQIDTEKKQLKLTSVNFGKLLSKDGFTYNMDGWTGRYGMPIEFTLALHLATMASGFTEELLTNADLQTDVEIILDKVDSSVEYKIKDKNGNEIAFSKEGVDLYDSYINGKEISKEDISICGIIDLIDKSQLQLSEDEIPTYLEGQEDSGELLGTIYKYNGLSKNIDAMKAITGNGKFVASIYNDFFTMDGSWMHPGTYICDLNESGFDGTTGILEVVLGKYKDGSTDEAIYEYQKDSNGNYILYENDNEYTGDSRYDLYKDHSQGMEWIELDGLNATTEMALKTLIIKASIPFGDDVASFRTEIEECVNCDDRTSKSNKLTELENGIFKSYEDEFKAFEKIIAYAEVFKQVDNFIVGYAVSNMCENPVIGDGKKIVDFEEFEKLNSKFYFDFSTTSGYIFENTGYKHGGGYYTQRFISCVIVTKENQTASTTGVSALYGESGLLKQLQSDCNVIASHYQNNDVVNDVLSSAGLTGISLDDIRQIYYTFTTEDDKDSQDANWVEARINKVTKHWYKDVDFSKAYGTTSEPKEIEYTEDTGLSGDYFVTAILTPKGKDEYHIQTSEPYVVKGDMIYLEGKVQTDISTDDLGDIEDDNYTWGDGYRATKKIFTEGAYYTFDGSEETTRSIYYQEYAIETFKDVELVVEVKNGRIISVNKANGESCTTHAITDVPQVWCGELESYESSVEVSSSDESEETKTQTLKTITTKYLLKLGNVDGESPLKYFSTARGEATYEESQRRVQQINAVWDALGVTVKRQPLSFDNTGSDGTMMALTAFSILENCKSEDAEYIYRDLKELLIDLGYFTKAEFDYISSDVLKWFIPKYRPKQWPMNKEEDYLEYGVILYPYEEQIEDEETNPDNQEQNSGEEIKGFKEDLEIIAPGTCTILDYDMESSTLRIKFNGVEQPEIAILNDYIMIIRGLKINETITLAGSDGKLTEQTVSISSAKENGTIIPVGSIIGKTGTEKIQVIMKNNRNAIINNVEDYMSTGIVPSVSQSYEFTEDEVVLLAYIINHEAAPEGLTSVMEHMQNNISGYSTVYSTPEEEAMAYAKAVGYVLINRALNNYGGYGLTIEEQSTAKGQYDGSFTIEYALEHQNEISAGSLEAAQYCAMYDCSAITNPEGVPMDKNVTGESAWTFNHQIFWWIDVDKNGKQDIYATSRDSATEEYPYPVSKGEGGGDPKLKEWPWDGYLTYSY